jgi:hypothetical protein
MTEAITKYYGKYRATVVNNVDPEQRGRIQAIVPDVLGLTPSSWAMPCVPLAGKLSGSYMLPEIGAGVWIEFEQGDPDYPIWAGCFWGVVGELPLKGQASLPATPNIVFETISHNSITIHGDPATGITLCAGLEATPSSPRITITPTGIVLTTGQATIALIGNTVTINQGALVII